MGARNFHVFRTYSSNEDTAHCFACGGVYFDTDLRECVLRQLLQVAPLLMSKVVSFPDPTAYVARSGKGLGTRLCQKATQESGTVCVPHMSKLTL